MKVSFVQLARKTKADNGYGYARQMCERSLTALGHEVVYLDPTADVEINFIQPHLAEWSGCDYRIMFTPWESTMLPDGWLEVFNEVDEVWTPSPIIAQWYEECGVKKPIYVYEHGVEKAWSYVPRTTGGRLQYLHHGAEALRKGGNDTIQAFMETLRYEHATLNMKMILQKFNIIDSEHIKIYKDKMDIKDLIALYQRCHVMVYPSYGEGFGLTPLQAMATGAGVIISSGWAPYEDLLPEYSLVKTSFIDSPWPVQHPGKVLKPDYDDLKDKLLWSYHNIDTVLEDAQKISEAVASRYDWIDLTYKAFEHLK